MLTLGQGDVGQLGLGENVLDRIWPSLVAFDEKIVDVCAGGMHTVCLTSDGEMYTFGCNDEGALGRDTSEEGSEFVPAKVELAGKVVQVSAGDSHTAALTEDGRAFAWGNFRDSKGQMGLTVQGQQRPTPLHILPSVRVSRIASGSDHLALLSHEGHLYTCGCGEQGQLGRIAECFTERGGRKGLELLLTPARVQMARNKKGNVIFNDVWAGLHATFARSTTGDIYACGLNNYNQLGFEDPKTHFNLQIVRSFFGREWSKISCGLHHTLSLDNQGRVYALGRKDYGRLGLGRAAEDVDFPTAIAALEDYKCVDVACGTTVSYAISENGLSYAWGMGSEKQLGTGNEDDQWEPIQMKGKQLDGRKAVAVSSGGQHVVLLMQEVELLPPPQSETEIDLDSGQEHS